jgi:hypothetical protein
MSDEKVFKTAFGEMTEEQLILALAKSVKYDKTIDRQRRATAMDRILIQKAREAGIEVTDHEIDVYLRQHPSRS